MESENLPVEYGGTGLPLIERDPGSDEEAVVRADVSDSQLLLYLLALIELAIDMMCP